MVRSSFVAGGFCHKPHVERSGSFAEFEFTPVGEYTMMGTIKQPGIDSGKTYSIHAAWMRRAQ